MKSSENYENIKITLSPARLATYEAFTTSSKQALELYYWNLQMSSALFECLAVCEVVVRNTVAHALKATYGDNWVWNNTFLLSLKDNAKETLTKINVKFDDIDKIVPELPFFFWQGIFTNRFDSRVWQHQLRQIMPNSSYDNLRVFRKSVFDDLDRIRKLRNRIAHHEPIFNRQLTIDYEIIIRIIGYRCQDTAYSLQSRQRITSLLDSKP